MIRCVPIMHLSLCLSLSLSCCQLRHDKYDPLPTAVRANKSTKRAATAAAADSETDSASDADDDDDDSVARDGDARDYNYLLSLPLWSLTLEKVAQVAFCVLRRHFFFIIIFFQSVNLQGRE